MPRPRNGRVGHSDGAAEHHVAKHSSVAKRRIAISPTRALLTRATVLGCAIALALGWVPTTAGAQTGSGSIAATRAAIDATATLWFAAQQRATDLDSRIQLLTNTIAAQEHSLVAIRQVADARAVQVYEDNTASFDTVLGSDPLDVGRRSELLGQANAQGQSAIDQLESSLSDLHAQRDQLRGARAAEAKAIRELVDQRRTLDVQLATLRRHAARSAVAHAVLAASVGRRVETATTAPATSPTLAAHPPPRAPATTPSPAVPPPDTGAVSPHHDEPFLVCTRARESNGEYNAVSPSGYYGAYQFAPTTWDVTATHLGRLDLVGVLPSTASEYDQDEMAWTLYEWQGNGPWGGRC